MSEPKLLTETQWVERLTQLGCSEGFDPLLNDLRERGLIAPEPVDPMRKLAREIAGAHGFLQDKLAENAILTALNRGREIERAERPKVTAEMVRSADASSWSWPMQADYINRQLYGDDA